MTAAMQFVKNIRVGLSIGNTLDATDDTLGREASSAEFETAWGNPIIQEELVDTILKAGFNLLRIPVSWKNHLGPAPEFAIEESWLDRVQEVVNYAYKKGAYVILNVHHEDWNYPYYGNQRAACDEMRAVWSQIAGRFAEYDEHLIFEGQNEPRKVGTPLEWNGGDKEGWDVVNATNLAFVETVRGCGGFNPNRFLMLPGYGANCTVGIKHIAIPEKDDRIIVSVHAYEPYEFALEIPGRSKWNHDTRAIDTLMTELKELYIDKGVPVIIGEFGAMNKDNADERAEWVEYYINAAAEIGVPCVWWDNGLFEGDGELFGLFSRQNYSCAYPGVVAGLLKGSERSAELKNMSREMKEHLLGKIIPFWRSLRDDENGGWYGYMSYDLDVDKKAVKGCILNSRITWFFANVLLCMKEGLITEEDCQAHGYSGEDIKREAEHGYAFLKGYCLDKTYGGIYWSLYADGTPEDTTKHTYNQAFCIYALSSYYEATGDEESLKLAFELYDMVEEKCTDDVGYLEAFTVDFKPESNEKLSENGVMAAKTMNTLLHVFEAYTQLYKVTGEEKVGNRLKWILNTFADKIYNPDRHRQEVFFDENYNSIIDLHSYGHDIETAWLIDRGLEVLGDKTYEEKLSCITKDLTAQIYKEAFNGQSLANECEKGVINTHRIWWVQAESVIGFLNGWQRDNSRKEYLEAALKEWSFIREFVVDIREGSEWFWEVDEEGKPYPDRPVVEPWKCPYHNGRMCMEVMRRAEV